MQRSFLAPLQRSLLALALACGASAAFAHGDMVPQAVDTSTLPQLGAKWLESNPYSSGEGHKEALRIGSSAYNQNCARCHGLEAVSGGIAPDLRKFDEECFGYADAAKKKVCFQEMDDFYAFLHRRFADLLREWNESRGASGQPPD